MGLRLFDWTRLVVPSMTAVLSPLPLMALEARSLPPVVLDRMLLMSLSVALTAPGTADLSAHVDFAAFAEAAHAGGAVTHGPVPQAVLLTALGVAQRAAVLRARATPSQRQALDDGIARLLDPGEMGTLFQAMALVSPGLPPPPGFEASL